MNYQNCQNKISHGLIKIEREQFYSLYQKEIYVVKCGTEVVDTYSEMNVNFRVVDSIAGIAALLGFTILLLWELKTKGKIWRWSDKTKKNE